MPLSEKYIEAMNKLQMSVSPSKSLATDVSNPAEYLRRMYHPGFTFYPEGYKQNSYKLGKKQSGITPSFVPWFHLITNDTFEELEKYMPLAIQSIGRIMRWMNREESPNYVKELMEVAIPLDPLALGTKPISYAPIYLNDGKDGNDLSVTTDDDGFEVKTKKTVIIHNPGELYDVAAKEAAYLDATLDELLKRQWTNEVRGVTFQEEFLKSRTMLILTAISNRDRKDLNLIENMIIKENDYWSPEESKSRNINTAAQTANAGYVTTQTASALVYALLPLLYQNQDFYNTLNHNKTVTIEKILSNKNLIAEISSAVVSEIASTLRTYMKRTNKETTPSKRGEAY